MKMRNPAYGFGTFHGRGVVAANPGTPGLNSSGQLGGKYKGKEFESNQWSYRNNTGLGPLPNPQELFAFGEQGAWYDPSDFSTLYQDSAGTTPVTAVEQPVGMIQDKSGRGNHAIQATSASRPVLSARVNLAVNTENGTAMFTLIPNVTTANGANGACQITRAAAVGDDRAQVNIAIAGGAAYTMAARFLKNFGTTATLDTFGAIGGVIPANSTTTINLTTGAVTSGPGVVTDLGTEWLVTHTQLTNTGNTVLGIAIRQPAGTTISVNKLDARLTADALPAIPTYQRVTTANDYDTVGFPYYLQFDGVDDSLVTAAINFTATDKMTVFAGVHKASDASAAVVTEFSVSSSVNAGSFALFAPLTPASTDFVWRGGGAAAPGNAATVVGQAAPATRVISGISKAGSPVEIRLNGVSTVGGNGSGNYGNYPLYIGGRAGTSLPFNGRIYTLIVRGEQSDSFEIANIENYVAMKSGVTL